MQDKVDDLYGEWRNLKGPGRPIKHISVRPAGAGAGVKVHVWGDCGGRDCDWGVQQAVVYEGDPKAQGEPRTAVHVNFDLDVSASHLIIMRNPRNRGLVVQVFNRDQSRRDRGLDEIKPVGGDTYSIERFERTKDAPVSARWDGGPRDKDLRDKDLGGGDPRDTSPRDSRAYAADNGRYDDRDRRYDGADVRSDAPEPPAYGPEPRGDGWRRYDDRPGEDRYRDGPDGDGRYGEGRDEGWRRDGVHEECVRFNPDHIDLSWAEGRWRIAEGRRWLFDFGGVREEAEHALDIIHFYRADQSCFVGRSGGRFTYLLRGGQPLSGSLEREDCERFDPGRIKVRRIDGGYQIVDGGRTLYDFGPREDEAQTAFEIIMKHGFGSACYAGRSGTGFRYLRR